MGYSPGGHKEAGTAQQLAHTSVITDRSRSLIPKENSDDKSSSLSDPTVGVTVKDFHVTPEMEDRTTELESNKII